MNILRILTILAALVLAGHPAFAVTPDEVLPDPALEARARSISAELRCMICQNQSIDDSDAELARDLWVLVRQRLLAGDSDAQVLDYVVSRYGEFRTAAAEGELAQCSSLGNAGAAAPRRRRLHSRRLPTSEDAGYRSADRRGAQGARRGAQQGRVSLPHSLPKFHLPERTP